MNAKSYESMNRVERITFTLTRQDFPVGTPAKEDGVIHRSRRNGSVAKVWDLCDRIIKGQGGTRADVLARAEKLGIAKHTARTQYDRWLAAGKKASKKRTAKKAAK